MYFIRVAALLSLLSTAAIADQFDTWNLVGGATVTHDGNLFRLPSNVDPLPLIGKAQRSDNIKVTSLGVRFDKSFSLQRFQFDYTASNYRYETFSHLNFTGSNYGGAWSWALTPYLHGTLAAKRSETLAKFSDYRSYSGRNIQRSEHQRFDGEWEAAGSWRIIAAINRDEGTNSQTFQQYSDFRSTGQEGGAKFVAASGNWVSLVARRSDGRYLNRGLVPESQYDNAYTSREEELGLHWTATGKSALDGRISRVSRVHEHFSQRDFSGYAGQLDYNWEGEGRLKLNCSVRQLLSPWQDNSSSYYVGRIVTFNPMWQLSSKVGLRIQLSQEEREYKGAILPVLVQRHDTLKSGAVTVNWTPLNSLALSASIQRDERASNAAGYDFTDTLFNLSGQFMF